MAVGSTGCDHLTGTHVAEAASQVNDSYYKMPLTLLSSERSHSRQKDCHEPETHFLLSYRTSRQDSPATLWHSHIFPLTLTTMRRYKMIMKLFRTETTD